MNWGAAAAFPFLGECCAGFVGLCVGSFLNVVIHRLPLGLFGREGSGGGGWGICFSRSRCCHCRGAIAARDNVPLLSYLLLRARCRHCRARISPRYPIVEGLVALLFVVAAIRAETEYALAGFCVLAAFLVVLAAIDLDHLILPDVLTVPLIGLGVAFNAGPGFIALPLSLLGAVVGYAFLWGVARGAGRIAGREALGRGDAKLLAALGAWLGFGAIVPAVALAVLVSALAMLVMRLRRGADATFHTLPMPFGPSLAAGGVLVALYNI